METSVAFEFSSASDKVLCAAALNKHLVSGSGNIGEPLFLDIIMVLQETEPNLLPFSSYMKLIQGLKMLVIVEMLNQRNSATILRDRLKQYFPDSCPAYEVQENEVGRKIKEANDQFLASVNDQKHLKEFLKTFPTSKIQVETWNLSCKLSTALELSCSTRERQMVQNLTTQKKVDEAKSAAHEALVPNLAVHLKSQVP